MNNKTKKTIQNITFSGVFIALLVTLQWGLGSMTGNNQFIVGSAVNLVLIISACVGGFIPGITVALVSPFFAFMFGIGTPFIELVPFIALGNLTLAGVWFFISRNYKNTFDMYIRFAISLVSAAFLKFIVLYLSIVKVMLPYLNKSGDINEKQVTALSKTFAAPQFLTALIGGSLALVMLPVLKKAYNNISGK